MKTNDHSIIVMTEYCVHSRNDTNTAKGHRAFMATLDCNNYPNGQPVLLFMTVSYLDEQSQVIMRSYHSTLYFTQTKCKLCKH